MSQGVAERVGAGRQCAAYMIVCALTAGCAGRARALQEVEVLQATRVRNQWPAFRLGQLQPFHPGHEIEEIHKGLEPEFRA